MFRGICAAMVTASVLAGWSARAQTQRTGDGRPKVVVISLDAFGAESLHDPHLPAPTLFRLMEGERMRLR